MSWNKDSLTEAIPRRSFIKSWLKFSSPTEQRLFLTKQRRQKKFERLLLLITRLHRIIRPSVSNTLSLRSRISYRNSTEQTKLAHDHLLAAPSFSLRLLYFIYTKSAEKDLQRNIPYISPTYVESQLTNFAKLESGMP